MLASALRTAAVVSNRHSTWIQIMVSYTVLISSFSFQNASRPFARAASTVSHTCCLFIIFPTFFTVTCIHFTVLDSKSFRTHSWEAKGAQGSRRYLRLSFPRQCDRFTGMYIHNFCNFASSNFRDQYLLIYLLLLLFRPSEVPVTSSACSGRPLFSMPKRYVDCLLIYLNTRWLFTLIAL